MSLGRLCYLVEQINAPLRDRNNAYLRKRYIKKRKPRGSYFNQQEKRKIAREWEIYNEADERSVKARQLYGPELSKLCRELNVRLKRMSMCPIIQTVVVKNEDGVVNRWLNGKAIRKFAMDYELDMIILDNYEKKPTILDKVIHE